MVAYHLVTTFPNLNLRIVFDPKLLVSAGTLKANIERLTTGDFNVMHSKTFLQTIFLGQYPAKCNLEFFSEFARLLQIASRILTFYNFRKPSHKNL